MENKPQNNNESAQENINQPVNEAPFRNIKPDVKLGVGVKIFSHVNLYGCEIGDNSMVGAFVEIQAGAKVGSNSRIQSHTFICEGIKIGNDCFIGHGVMFINDNNPSLENLRKENENEEDWKKRINLVETIIQDNVNIGSNVTILGGITIEKGAIIGAGSVVTKSVPAGETWAGNPAKKLEK